MNLYLSLRTQQKLGICHFAVCVDIFDSHHSSQGVIDHLVEWHFSGIRHDGLNRSFATLRLTDEHIHHKKQDQLSLSTYHCEEATSLLVEPIECRVADCEEKEGEENRSMALVVLGMQVLPTDGSSLGSFSCVCSTHSLMPSSSEDSFNFANLLLTVRLSLV